ncbi:hypothetical protein OQA88_752 [Cercophora sp. LCS_1]
MSLTSQSSNRRGNQRKAKQSKKDASIFSADLESKPSVCLGPLTNPFVLVQTTTPKEFVELNVIVGDDIFPIRALKDAVAQHCIISEKLLVGVGFTISARSDLTSLIPASSFKILKPTRRTACSTSEGSIGLCSKTTLKWVDGFDFDRTRSNTFYVCTRSLDYAIVPLRILNGQRIINQGSDESSDESAVENDKTEFAGPHTKTPFTEDTPRLCDNGAPTADPQVPSRCAVPISKPNNGWGGIFTQTMTVIIEEVTETTSVAAEEQQSDSSVVAPGQNNHQREVHPMELTTFVYPNSNAPPSASLSSSIQSLPPQSPQPIEPDDITPCAETEKLASEASETDEAPLSTTTGSQIRDKRKEVIDHESVSSCVDESSSANASIIAFPNDKVLRQVGLATLRLDGLSLSRQGHPDRDSHDFGYPYPYSHPTSDNDERSDSSSECFSSKATEPEGACDNGGSSNTQNPSESASGSASGQSSSAATPSTAGGGLLSPSDGGEGRRKRRRGPTNSENNDRLGLRAPRFACPYQSYEKWRGCLSRVGGCNGISRLKYRTDHSALDSFKGSRLMM